MTIYAVNVVDDDGNETDIMAELATLYDVAVGSMDWGSGMLDNDEVAQVRKIARLMGYADVEYQHDKCSACGHDREQHHSFALDQNRLDERFEWCSGGSREHELSKAVWAMARNFQRHPEACPCEKFAFVD